MTGYMIHSSDKDTEIRRLHFLTPINGVKVGVTSEHLPATSIGRENGTHFIHVTQQRIPWFCLSVPPLGLLVEIHEDAVDKFRGAAEEL